MTVDGTIFTHFSYQEKFYFNLGDTGFKVINTRFAKLGERAWRAHGSYCTQVALCRCSLMDSAGAFTPAGCLVCWDQWFPEAARACALQGAEVLL